MNELKQTILTIIAEAPGSIKTADIRAHKKLRDEESAHISQKIFELKRDALIVAGEARDYSVTAKGLAALGRSAEHKAPARKARGASSPPLSAKPDGGIEQILLEAEEHAQGALDRYLTTVGDLDIIGPLRNARDSAREALKRYREKQ
jgi:hypothetical protein